MNDPDLTLVESFAALVDELHVGRAAARLGVAPTVLSQRLARLERQLGVRLAQRSARAVTLTAAGEVFGRAAHDTMTAIDQALVAARAAARSAQREVRLGWTADSELIMRRVVREARLADHGLTLSFHGMVERALLAELRDSHIDLAFVCDLHDGGDPALVREPLVGMEGGVLLRSDHRLATRETVTAAELADEPFVLFPRGTAPHVHDALVAALRPAGAPIRVVEPDTFGAHTSMTAAVLADGGFCSMARSIVTQTRPPGLSFVPLDPMIATPLTAVYRRDDEAAVAPVVDTIRRTVADRPDCLPEGSWPWVVTGPDPTAR